MPIPPPSLLLSIALLNVVTWDVTTPIQMQNELLARAALLKSVAICPGPRNPARTALVGMDFTQWIPTVGLGVVIMSTAAYTATQVREGFSVPI